MLKNKTGISYQNLRVRNNQLAFEHLLQNVHTYSKMLVITMRVTKIYLKTVGSYVGVKKYFYDCKMLEYKIREKKITYIIYDL